MNEYTVLEGYGLDCLVYRDRSEMGIKQTPRTPFVWFLGNGELHISGRLIPEYSDMFLSILEEWMEESGAWNKPRLKINIALEYTTAMASKLLLHMLRKFAAHCQELIVTWHYYKDQPYMLDLGQLLAESMDRSFDFVSMDNNTDILKQNYRVRLADARKLSRLIKSRIAQFNQVSQKGYTIEDFQESILHELKEEGCRELAQEIIILKSKYHRLNLQIDQCRLSIMTRDLREGKELDKDIRNWWADRY